MSTPILPDNPILTSDADLLGRGPFAKSLADLIVNAPSGSSLRIGVFGGWGEGKTSVLQVVRGILESEGHVTAWLVPWVTENREEITQQLTLQIAEKLRIDLRRLKVARTVQGLASKAGELMRDDTKLRVFDAIFDPAVRRTIGTFVNRQGEALAQAIADALGSRKLIVFVDDVDRVKPELVPNLLLTLREALDRPDFFYIMALDPQVIEKGLGKVHEAWGSPGDFLEKIIEIPRFLPEPSEEAVQRYAHALISSVESMDPAPVSDILPLLPRNPRRLKLFIRYVATLVPLTRRFVDWELDLRAFYLLQLLQLEFPEQIRAALKDAEFVDDIQYAAVRDTIVAKAASTAQDHRAPTSMEQNYVAGHPHAGRFSDLCDALRQRGYSAWAYYSLPAALSLPENPPLFTYRECIAVADAWVAGNQDAQAFLAQVSVFGTLDSTRCRAFWYLLMNVHDMRMGDIIEEDLQDRIAEELRKLSALTKLAFFLAIGKQGFHLRLLSLEEWRALYKVTAKWARFNKPDYYRRAREEERELLRQAFSVLTDEDKAALYSSLEPSPHGEETSQTPEFVELLRTLATEAAQAAVSTVLTRFNEPNGLEKVWATEMNNPMKTLLFRYDSILYQDQERRKAFLDLADGAKDSISRQLNFLTFFRQLAYGSTQPSSFPVEDCRKILGDGEIASAVWTAAISRPLNPRIVGSLRGHRLKLVSAGVIFQEQMPIPEWWKRLEQAGFWRDSNNTTEDA